MVLLTGELPWYPVDDIVKRTPCTLMVPNGRMMSKKKEVARGVALCQDGHDVDQLRI